VYVESLLLENYRNYTKLKVEFPGLIHLFLGENAQGKTNLLEAISLLATGRSARAAKDAELINWGANKAQLRANIVRNYGVVQISIDLFKNAPRKTRVNGTQIRRADLFGYVNVVSFTPDDLQLVKGSPSQRRAFLDYEIAQVSPPYRFHLAQYNRALKQRNAVLKSIVEKMCSPSLLEEWDQQLIEHGSQVVIRRSQMIDALRPLTQAIHKEITSDKEDLVIDYEPFFDRDKKTLFSEDLHQVQDCFRKEFVRLKRAEMARGVSLVGPQRDDVVFHINGQDMRVYGSQGQQRSVVLSCKLAEIVYMENEVGEAPILLLDDVMSELDSNRRNYLIDVVKNKVQTFITSAHKGDLSDNLLSKAMIHRICSGRIETVLE
jgi:DNA replication and repair protein RecF